MSSQNSNLSAAKTNKSDEFYTQLTDIEKEMKHYRSHFKDKVIFCNCDDPEVSNFWQFFSLNFEFFGLKKLISTHYEADKASYKLEMYKDINGDGRVTQIDTIKTPLKQNGDFRSPESIEILKESDIVVSNPPFSLFREYVAQLAEHNKKFIIVGHQNAITYKETFALIKEGKLWLGRGFTGGAAHFINKHYDDYATAGDHQDGMIRVSGVVWFTNIGCNNTRDTIVLYKKYSTQEYPKYDNYDAIEVSKVKDIPMDYAGVMGVPITFMDKFNPEQFEILGCSDRGGDGQIDYLHTPHKCRSSPIIGEKKVYKRIFIKHYRPQV